MNRNQLHYENMMLKNTNYYLLCTLFNLEKKQLSKVEGELQEIQTIMNNDDKGISDKVLSRSPSPVPSPVLEPVLSPVLEPEQEESEPIEDKEEENLLRQELEDVKQEMLLHQQSLETKIKDLETKKIELEDQLRIENKENQNIINRMRKENDHLHNNNNQLQSELMKILKYKVGNPASE